MNQVLTPFMVILILHYFGFTNNFQFFFKKDVIKLKPTYTIGSENTDKHNICFQLTDIFCETSSMFDDVNPNTTTRYINGTNIAITINTNVRNIICLLSNCDVIIVPPIANMQTKT